MVVMARLSRPERPDLVFEEEDLPYEEEIMRNQFSVKCWLRYIEFKQGAPKPRLNQLYERALKLLPCSYKLWYRYLKARRAQVKHRCVTDPAYEDVNNCHERAFVFMHKMPRLWLDYCQFLMDQGRVTHTRRTFDRALRALPITQHSRIWPLYLRFLRSHPLPETAVRGYRRFLKLSPESAEEYIEYLKSSDRLDEAAQRLATVVNDERFVSKAGKSNYQLWHELCDLISQNPDKVQSLNVDAIIRGGLTRFTDQLGKLWCSLADYYIRSGHFEKARDVYEEAIRTVMTVRDFTQVFDSYAQFEESMIAAKMETASELGREEEDDVDLELRLARFEQLISRRPLLLNSVLLRQNPHHVHEWHKRVALHQGRPREIINTYTEAVQTVDPFKATGKPHTLWVAFAKFYEDNGQLDDARVILEKATKVSFKQVDDLASVWCECGELELRHENYDQALRLLRKATALPARRAEYFDGSEPVQNRVYKSLKVWSMLADLEESLGTFQSTKAVYDRILDLRIATPQIVINYAMFLEEHKYFEESFKAYERGISLFKWPNVSDIWSTYLTKFIARYGGRKLERARDLFEQALDGCPPKYAKSEGGQMVLGGRGASQAQPLISNPTPCFVLPQRCTCCTRSWKKSGAWRGTPWQCMSVPPGLWSPRSSTTCSTSTSSGRLRSTGSPTPAASIRRPLRCCLTSTPGRCACGSLTWSASSGRSTAPGPYTASARRSATPGRPGPSGKRGRTLRSGMATRTPSGRCCGSAAACRPHTTHRSTSWPRRCSRCRAAPRALCPTWPPGRAVWMT
uniref:Pre-mRNA-splicing factor SYF1 n=1 Tax=Bos taurus TaxID=9913 RepID=A0A3Q1LL70_BOVIN